MANTQTSGILAAALNDKIINEAFEIARSNRTGILQVVNFGEQAAAYEGYKMSWLDFRIDAQSSESSGAALAAATTISVATGGGAKFRPGTTFSAEGSDEIILVTSVSGDDLTVVRGFGGTTAEDIADATKLTIDSVGREENSLAANDGIFQPETVENFFQTMDTAVEFSRRALSTLQFGNTNDLQFQVAERIRQLTIQMDRALVRGRKAVATIGGNDVSYTGGLRYYLDQAGAIKTDNSAAALTLDQINALNAEIVSRGGMADTIAVGIKQARKLSALVSANYSSQRLGDWTADEGSLLTLPSDLPLVGSVNRIVVDTNLADDELIIFDAGKVSVKPMAANNASTGGAWQTKDATQNGQDGERVRVLGDFAMEVRQSKTHMARLHNIA
jgi:hypothetical protein